MLLGDNAAEYALVSDGAKGCTFDHKVYHHNGYNFYDTVGLSEGSKGLTAPKTALDSLVKLLKSLADGVNLLIFVMKKDRIRKTFEQNYKIFVEAMCKSEVPVILVITNCELEKNMSDWWEKNKEAFKVDYRMVFSDGIGVCATKGENLLPEVADLLKKRYKESREILYNSIKKHVRPVPWKMTNWYEWFTLVLKKCFNLLRTTLGWPPISYWNVLKELLVSWGISPKDATKISNIILEGMVGFPGLPGNPTIQNQINEI
jgi:hypothetical protein